MKLLPKFNFSKFSRTAQVFVVIALINFFSFLAVTLVLGGGALNGHVEAGHYFLSSHGKLTETTEQIFRYSQIHGASLFITHPLGIIFEWLGRPVGGDV